eukprot:TRINITY_DN777_c0_g1_i1.p1 TRINITY_DN777_c0_g1~~TRINITY_DN777_c0_g1_i1.p1  ORF type:complete len:183 (-),score=5.93 TRINITY_DN777_c0_g1_i1:161-709(-)
MNLLHLKGLARAAARSQFTHLICSASNNQGSFLSGQIQSISHVLHCDYWLTPEPGPKRCYTGPASQRLLAAYKRGAGYDGTSDLMILERLKCSPGSRTLTTERKMQLEASSSQAANLFEELAEGLPLAVRASATAGREMYAAEEIAAGDVIQDAAPIVAHPTLNNVDKRSAATCASSTPNKM